MTLIAAHKLMRNKLFSVVVTECNDRYIISTTPHLQPLPVRNKPDGFCGRKATLKQKHLQPTAIEQDPNTFFV